MRGLRWTCRDPRRPAPGEPGARARRRPAARRPRRARAPGRTPRSRALRTRRERADELARVGLASRPDPPGRASAGRSLHASWPILLCRWDRSYRPARMPRCPLRKPKTANLQGFPRSTTKSCSGASEEVRRCGADPGAAVRGRGGAARRARRGRAALARLRGSLAAFAARSARRGRHSRQGRLAQAHALVRRAARLRPALVQRSGAPPHRRPSGAGRPAGGRGSRIQRSTHSGSDSRSP